MPASQSPINPMEKEDFIREYCERSGESEEELIKYEVALPCHCGEPGCKGWAMVTNTPLAIRAHQSLYGAGITEDNA